jgi:putative (di)nucleoside polyphosphate hydrolase
VYASALRHLAPFARQVAGVVAIPQPAKDPRLDAMGAPRAYQRPRRRKAEAERSGGSEPGAN